MTTKLKKFVIAITYIKFVEVEAKNRTDALEKADRLGLINSTDPKVGMCNWHVAEPS